LTNIASWRVKETDRLTAMATELRKLGAGVEEGPDWLRVAPPREWHAAAIHTYDDHRMAMCGSLAAFGGVPVRILDPSCVRKTFPRYFKTLFKLVRAEASQVPVITIDGPTASGKGTLAAEVALRLGYRLLDSGSLYRVTALAAQRAGLLGDDPLDEAAIAALAGRLPGPGGSHRGAARRGDRPGGLARLGAAGGAACAARAAAVVPPPARAGGRRARHGHRGVLRRTAQGVPHRERRPARGTTV
jgi:hypothetical protein